MIRLALGFAAGFVAAFVVMGRARQAALEADPYAQPFGDQAYIPQFPSVWTHIPADTNTVTTWVPNYTIGPKD